MSSILEFISVFQSEENKRLFTECACYYFAEMLRVRFPTSTLMYDPQEIHFAVKISDTIYDITGIVEYTEDYIPWSEYVDYDEEDASRVLSHCIRLERS